jgi:hypothetical protein
VWGAFFRGSSGEGMPSQVRVFREMIEQLLRVPASVIVAGAKEQYAPCRS